MTKNKASQKKILYLMHIDWGWAKQRPHFIAEHLADRYDVTVNFKRQFRQSTLSENKSSSKLKFNKLFVFPFSRFKIIEILNKILVRAQLINKCSAEIIWVTHPAMYEYVRYNLSNSTHLVYDCMDDILEFPDALNNKNKLESLKTIEAQLTHRSDVIIASSVNLKRKLADRHGCESKVTVVNNALTIPSYNQIESVENQPYSVQEFHKINGPKILYIGTISSWFDFETITDSLTHFDNITYVLIGPCEVDTPKHKRIIILPPVEHKHVYDLMKSANALIMPFIVNDLIKSVNPVKLYEYIYSKKPALAVSYEETEAFKDHVHLYRSREELYSYLELLVSDGLSAKSSEKDAIAFVESNTWENRLAQIYPLLENQPRISNVDRLTF